jgi:CDP-4-dehydro-6-deoxyglucose reductase, E1
LVEDNCESMGAKFKNKMCGKFGLWSSLSSYFSHHISTIEGGYFLTDDEELYSIALALRSHGWARDKKTLNFLIKVILLLKKENFCFFYLAIICDHQRSMQQQD